MNLVVPGQSAHQARSQLGVILIAHGSRVPEANAELFEVADRLSRGGFACVAAAFLELAEPDILSAGVACVASGARRIIMAPYFLSAGRHVSQDLEASRLALTERHPGVEFLLAPPLGPDPLLETLLMQRITRTAQVN